MVMPGTSPSRASKRLYRNVAAPVRFAVVNRKFISSVPYSGAAPARLSIPLRRPLRAKKYPGAVRAVSEKKIDQRHAGEKRLDKLWVLGMVELVVLHGDPGSVENGLIQVVTTGGSGEIFCGAQIDLVSSELRQQR